jgi:hypothetical protein
MLVSTLLLYTLVQNYTPFCFSACLIAPFSRLSTNSTEFSPAIFSSKQFSLYTPSDRNSGPDLSPPRSANCELLLSLFSVHQSLLLTSCRFLRILDISDIDALVCVCLDGSASASAVVSRETATWKTDLGISKGRGTCGFVRG